VRISPSSSFFSLFFFFFFFFPSIDRTCCRVFPTSCQFTQRNTTHIGNKKPSLRHQSQSQSSLLQTMTSIGKTQRIHRRTGRQRRTAKPCYTAPTIITWQRSSRHDNNNNAERAAGRVRRRADGDDQSVDDVQSKVRVNQRKQFDYSHRSARARLGRLRHCRRCASAAMSSAPREHWLACAPRVSMRC
jgi:hypothetical protein